MRLGTVGRHALMPPPLPGCLCAAGQSEIQLNFQYYRRGGVYPRPCPGAFGGSLMKIDDTLRAGIKPASTASCPALWQKYSSSFESASPGAYKMRPYTGAEMHSAQGSPVKGSWHGEAMTEGLSAGDFGNSDPLRQAFGLPPPLGHQGEAFYPWNPLAMKNLFRERNLLHLDLVYIDVKYGMHRAM